MPDAKHYTNAQNFRQALDERLKNMARQKNVWVQILDNDDKVVHQFAIPEPRSIH